MRASTRFSSPFLRIHHTFFPHFLPISRTNFARKFLTFSTNPKMLVIVTQWREFFMIFFVSLFPEINCRKTATSLSSSERSRTQRFDSTSQRELSDGYSSFCCFALKLRWKTRRSVSSRTRRRTSHRLSSMEIIARRMKIFRGKLCFQVD